MEEIIIARRIKAIRTEKGLTLDELARLTGFTKSLLSKIENNKVSPPISTLATIARALEVSLGDFFSAADMELIKIVRGNERISYHPENLPLGQKIENLISGFAKQKMEPMMISIDDPDNYEIKFYSHPGQEFIYILNGSMHYRYNDQDFMLHAGDSVYFDAGYLHGPLPISGQKVEYLSVLGT